MTTLLTVEDVAKAAKFHRETILEKCREGVIPGARKVGRVWRIPVEGYEQWISGSSEGAASPQSGQQGSTPAISPLAGSTSLDRVAALRSAASKEDN